MTRAIAIRLVAVMVVAGGLVGCTSRVTTVPDGLGLQSGDSSAPLTAQRIASTSDDDLPGLVKDAIWNAATTGGNDHALFEGLMTGRRSTKERRAVWTAETLNQEILNGGFVQYFGNYGTGGVTETVAGLRRMGAARHAGILEEAARRWNREAATIKPLFDRHDPAAEARSKLPPLDDQWVAVPLEPIEAAYIRANVEAFLS